MVVHIVTKSHKETVSVDFKIHFDYTLASFEKLVLDFFLISKKCLTCVQVAVNAVP